MTRARLGIACASALVLLSAGAPAWPQPGTPTDAKKSEEQAMAVVKRMAEFSLGYRASASPWISGSMWSRS